MLRRWLTAEKYPSSVGAAFDSAEQARAAADAVEDQMGTATASLRIIEPEDPELERKLEPESKGIAKTMIKAHIVLGIVGAVAGLVLALVLVAFGVPLFTASPVLATVVAVAFGAVFGLLLGGFVGFRPDHDPLIEQARENAQAGRWFVVVHTNKPAQRDAARTILERHGDGTIGTI